MTVSKGDAAVKIRMQYGKLIGLTCVKI